MGYTHYFERPKTTLTLEKETIAWAASLAKEVCEEPVFGQFVKNLPKDKDGYSGIRVFDDGVYIDGYAQEDGDCDLSCESLGFSFHGEDLFSCCKTNRKPYDLTVVAILTAWEMAGIVEKTSSDSGIENFEKNWHNLLTYSVEECLSLYKDDEYVKMAYKIPTAREAVDAFQRCIERIDDKGWFAMPEKAKPSIPTSDKASWF